MEIGIGGIVGIIIVGVIIAIVIYSAYSSYSSDKKFREDEQRKRYGRLMSRINAYHNHLIKDCGYEFPYDDDDPLGSECEGSYHIIDYDEYEEDYKRLKLKASVTINHTTYDIRESKLNRLKIENDELRHHLTDLELQALYAREFLEYLYIEGHSEILEKSWKKFAKKYEVVDSIPYWHHLFRSDMLSGEVDDVDAIVERAKKRGKPITDERIKELKEIAKLQEKKNKLYEDYVEYKKHELCSDRRCDEGWDTKKCKALRKKFDKYEEEYDEFGLPF